MWGFIRMHACEAPGYLRKINIAASRAGTTGLAGE